MAISIVDVLDSESFGLIPVCADARFDHRTCDYWEDAERGSKLSRPALLEVHAPSPRGRPAPADNPFAPPARPADENLFAPQARAALPDAFADDDLFATPLDNPFAPVQRRERPLRVGVPRKLALLDRGRGVFGSYAKVLLAGAEPVAYCQFGPLSAYPRAARLRELYAQLPVSPLPAVITCIASTAEGRRQGHARRLVEEVCRDLAERGFAAVESYPDLTRPEDETSAARPGFWHALGFTTAVDDERFPVMRREL
ncbi:MAG TPA: GNAT family N-acetyltransferase [Candidatus Limnocylindria bacterium]|nr:GNAT family N-acetyltransferase [Candidatus Limnocylindria bacterium]